MAATDPSVHDPTETGDREDQRVGLAHPTVVPTNFDPDAPSGRDE
ncbi:hypothetical protein [Natrarchaeobius chitinivorans]|nr:hypothetical protein [Natrarchaeobius chitinivorans]